MRIYERKDGSYTIDGVNFKSVQFIGWYGEYDVFLYSEAENSSNVLVTIEVDYKIKDFEYYTTIEEFESEHGEYDPYNSDAQGISFLKLCHYL